jgi:hypothetical protein
VNPDIYDLALAHLQDPDFKAHLSSFFFSDDFGGVMPTIMKQSETISSNSFRNHLIAFTSDFAVVFALVRDRRSLSARLGVANRSVLPSAVCCITRFH